MFEHKTTLLGLAKLSKVSTEYRNSDEFRQRVSQDKMHLVDELGLPRSQYTNKQIEIALNQDGFKYFVIPASQDFNLSEDDLRNVVAAYDNAQVQVLSPIPHAQCGSTISCLGTLSTDVSTFGCLITVSSASSKA